MASIAQHPHFQQPLRNKATDFAFSERMRRLSSQEKTRNNGKDRESTLMTAATNGIISGGSTFMTEHDYHSSPRPSLSGSSPARSKRRGSILHQASDALYSTFSRRRKPTPLPPGPIILPGVMEISASRRDNEVEERDRLRDAAAQSLGLGPEILDPQPRAYSIDEVDEDAVSAEGEGDFEIVDHPLFSTRSVRSGSISSKPGNTPSISSRRRAGSYTPSLTHIRTRSTTPASATPSFPSSLANLRGSTSMAAIFPKYHAPSSLLIYALSKQWKPRYITLSSIPANSRIQAPVSYLHVFKSAGPEERELERLEINEESVVFVADEEVGARRGVVKVGGVEVGGATKELDEGRAMWLLQIADPLEAQRWITAIKSAILSQRSMRAGLGIPAQSPTGNEPRGDMDVMLTMRAQGIYSSPTPKRGILPEFSNGRSRTPSVDVPDTSRSSPLSMQSHAATVTSQSSGAASTIKALFTNAKHTRSSSRAAQNGQEASSADGSFGTMGSNLLSLKPHDESAESSSSISPPRSSTTPSTSTQKIILSSPITTSSERLKHQRSNDLPSVTWEDSHVASISRQELDIPIATLLQPPPHRKLSTIEAPKAADSGADPMYQHSRANDSVADNFGVKRSPLKETFTLPTAAGPSTSVRSFGSPEPLHSPEASVSTTTSADSEHRRWSRQPLPQRLTPPAGPRPAPSTRDPRTSSEDRRTSWLRTTVQHPYASERSSSPASSANSPQSLLSGPASSTKRESNSSVSTASTSHSRFSMSRRGGSQRRSIPPPAHPAPVSALPATPTESALAPTETPRPSKTSFRNSVAQRAIRMSLSAPKPPPSISLPPRPDEKTYRHRRSISNGGLATDMPPASPPAEASFLPSSSPPASPISPSRHTSLKQRLRILSAPSSTPSIRSLTTTIQNLRSATPPITNVDPWVSQPSTPIAEPITSDPNFLYFPEPEPKHILRAPSPELPPPSPEIFPGSPEIMSLSPPPRRGSRHASMLERQRLSQVIAETPEEPVKEGEATQPSLSQPDNFSRASF